MNGLPEICFALLLVQVKQRKRLRMIQRSVCARSQKHVGSSKAHFFAVRVGVGTREPQMVV